MPDLDCTDPSQSSTVFCREKFGNMLPCEIDPTSIQCERHRELYPTEEFSMGGCAACEADSESDECKRHIRQFGECFANTKGTEAFGMGGCAACDADSESEECKLHTRKFGECFQGVQEEETDSYYGSLFNHSHYPPFNQNMENFGSSCSSAAECQGQCEEGFENACKALKRYDMRRNLEMFSNKEMFSNERSAQKSENYIFSTSNQNGLMNTPYRVNAGRNMPSSLISQSSEMLGLTKNKMNKPAWRRPKIENFSQIEGFEVLSTTDLDLHNATSNITKAQKWDAMNNSMGQAISPGILLQKQKDNSFSKRNIGENTRKV